MCEKPAVDGVVHPKCKTRYGLDGVYSFFHYRQTVPYLIKALKYRAVSDSAQTCVTLIFPSSLRHALSFVNSSDAKDSVCIPIPLHPSREKIRGFNQSEVLGRYIMQKLHIPMNADILYRTRKTTPQVDMKERVKRLQNMNHAFAVREPIDRVPSHILLFDDVWTTGATMRAAANVLKRRGARSVWAVTFAR